ncbi:YetF domain-containing protein [Gemmobacter sp. 24YEA27]|uniref:DUF421 domain-containing protein n=1 Tax=Gemmobacter sp. 24YEA27 TaxID=3040672 RepID=UPI0024B37E9B|nr:YetF domain-containing protein [Gemmobacter sp. 24YEA27]
MQAITPFDWVRLFLGEDPPLFYLEIVFRILVIWIWTMALLRWIGGRSISQLSVVEFLLVIALGAAVGDAMFYPEVPLAHAMLVIAVLVVLDKAVDYAIRRYRLAKRIIEGQPVAILRNGVILCDGLSARQLGSLELMEMLRLKGVENLASLRVVYLEPSGKLSMFPAENPQPGLSIMPPREEVKGDVPDRGATACCEHCGMVADPHAPCPNCGGDSWVRATPAPKWRQ